MGAPKIDLCDTHLNLMNKGSMDKNIYRKMALFISSSLFYITNSMIFIVGFIASHVFRTKLEDSSRRDDSNVSAMKVAKDFDPAPEPLEPPELEMRDSDSVDEEETSSFCFKFQYQFSEDIMRSMGKPTNSVVEENLNGFVKKPEAMMLRPQEHEDNTVDEEKLNTEFTPRFLSVKDFWQSDTFSKFNKRVESKDVIMLKNKLLEEDIPIRSETNSLDEKEIMDGVRFLSEGFSGFDSDSESMSDGYSVKNLVVDSESDGFLSEDDFGGDERESDITEATMHSNRHEVELQLSYNFDTQSDDSGDEFEFNLNQTNYGRVDDELRLENGSKYVDIEGHERGFDENKREENLLICQENQLQRSSSIQIEFTDSSDEHLSSFRTDSNRLSSSDEPEVFYAKDLAGPEVKPEDLEEVDVNHLPNLRNSNAEFDKLSVPTNGSSQVDAELQKSEETPLEDLDSDDLYELESLWEHQDLIEQLKIELKKVRAGGLPTILEESESPKSIEDLKPWKIDEKFLNEDPMDELHKFYKSYREKMRKLDILNYQKMYAIGFLQLKDPLQSMGSHKPLIPTVISHLSKNFRRLRRSSTDPSAKFLKELQSDLEMVYVGQTCLSWEFLRWQYEKARGLPECDPYRSHQYNQVAGEFQQFQVNTQRFIENESFQGPRLPNYVRNRCVLRNLIQVPLIKDDCFNDKMEGQRKGDNAITSEMLEDIMEESISIFWEFVKADKNEAPAILMGLFGAQAELQDPSDHKLMADVHVILQKKEKKLKDILRTGNCLVKKFKKPQEDRSNQDLFFSQIDLKLVWMVLKMSRITTDQLVWCLKKLSKIRLAEGKVEREHSFLLFPC